MIIALFILWVLMWGAAGYFTVRTIQIRKQNKQIAQQIMYYNNLLAEADKAVNHKS